MAWALARLAKRAQGRDPARRNVCLHQYGDTQRTHGVQSIDRRTNRRIADARRPRANLVEQGNPIALRHEQQPLQLVFLLDADPPRQQPI
jgi:hypothetical protein